jgi:hypothetical protein
MYEIDLAGPFRAEVPYFAVFVDYPTRITVVESFQQRTDVGLWLLVRHSLSDRQALNYAIYIQMGLERSS